MAFPHRSLQQYNYTAEYLLTLKISDSYGVLKVFFIFFLFLVLWHWGLYRGCLSKSMGRKEKLNMKTKLLQNLPPFSLFLISPHSFLCCMLVPSPRYPRMTIVVRF